MKNYEFQDKPFQIRILLKVILNALLLVM